MILRPGSGHESTSGGRVLLQDSDGTSRLEVEGNGTVRSYGPMEMQDSSGTTRFAVQSNGVLRMNGAYTMEQATGTPITIPGDASVFVVHGMLPNNFPLLKPTGSAFSDGQTIIVINSSNRPTTGDIRIDPGSSRVILYSASTGQWY